MRALRISLLMLSVTTVFGQKAPNPKPYASSITEADLRKQLSIVASAEMEGRETATAGQRRAASYLESQFKTLGLLPGNGSSYQQEYPVYRDSLVSARLVVGGNEMVYQTDFQPSLSSNAQTLYFSEILFAGHGIADSTFNNYGSAAVAGKAVLILEGAPSAYKNNRPGFLSPAGLQGKIAAARERGISMLMIAGSGLTPPQANMYVNLFRTTQNPAVVMITDKTAAALIGPEWSSMKEKAQQEKPTPQTFKTQIQYEFQKKTSFMKSSNVIGVLEGSDKKAEYLVISAHYDHLGKGKAGIFYGADDDGSGTVGVLEIAEAFAKAKAEGRGPRRSIIFLLVSGEEKGLWGSAYYADHPTVSTTSITANLNIDMIGRVDTQRKTSDTLNYVYVVGDDKLSTELKPLSESINKKYTKLSLDYKFNDPKDINRIYFRSDHYNFAKVGVPVIFYYDGMLLGDYHRVTDTIEKINFKLLARRAQLVFHTAWEMTQREAPIRRDLPIPKF